MADMNRTIAAAARALEPDLVDFLSQLIAIPSPSGGEGAVVGRLREEMEKIGYDEVRVDPIGNLIGRLGSGPRVIAIDGHCDTVGTGDPGGWDGDPFEARDDGRVIYGRGACDQKGGLAAAVFAGKIIKEIGIPEEISLYVVASVLEEDYEGLSWRTIIEENGIKPEAVVLTEPTDSEIKIGQRGRLEMKLTVRGISCHGSAPHRGDNAVYKITPIVDEIAALNQSLPPSGALGRGTIAVTDVRSSSPSLCAVPDSAAIHLDRRMTEGEDEASCVAEIKALNSVREAGAEVSVPEYRVESHTGLVRSLRANFPAWVMDPRHPLVETAREVCRRQLGRDPGVGVWGFSTNGVATNGIHGIPSIGFGPGFERHAHTAEDQVEKEELRRALEFYAAFVLEGNHRPDR